MCWTSCITSDQKKGLRNKARIPRCCTLTLRRPLLRFRPVVVILLNLQASWGSSNLFFKMIMTFFKRQFTRMRTMKLPEVFLLLAVLTIFYFSMIDANCTDSGLLLSIEICVLLLKCNECYMLHHKSKTVVLGPLTSAPSMSVFNNDILKECLIKI